MDGRTDRLMGERTIGQMDKRSEDGISGVTGGGWNVDNDAWSFGDVTRMDLDAVLATRVDHSFLFTPFCGPTTS